MIDKVEQLESEIAAARYGVIALAEAYERETDPGVRAQIASAWHEAVSSLVALRDEWMRTVRARGTQCEDDQWPVTHP